MGEGHVQKFIQAMRLRLFLYLLIVGLLLIAILGVLLEFTDLSKSNLLIVLTVICLLIAAGGCFIIASILSKPTTYLAQTIIHINPSEQLVAPPNLDKLKFGYELISTLARQVYGYTEASKETNGEFSFDDLLFNQLPMAILGIDENGVIKVANTKLQKTLNSESVTGQNLKDVLIIVTEETPTIEEWLKNSSENSLTASRIWQKAELKTINNDSLGYFDIAISFNKHSANGIEAILAFADHSEAYEEEHSSISFVSLAVHELRTPVTLLRGYVETFEDELGPQASPQLRDDLRKMSASTETLTTFISNILNVARINQGQLSLNLQEDNWNEVLPQIVDTLRNRAGVYGKTIELRMQPNLPKVAVDRITIGEVVTNLIDNAIKYSPEDAQNIRIVSRLNKEGLIETTFEDKGVGIPESVMPNLFSKFYRNHRNRSQIGGTGLGLFLSKTIVNAHNGNIWVNSKEGEGSTFGFTILPYAQLAKEQKVQNNENIVRSSHGWIKNHSKQRR